MVLPKMSSIQLIIIKGIQKQENMTCERKESVEGHREAVQMLDLADMDFKITITNMQEYCVKDGQHL